MRKSYRFVVSGRVQGVFYRASAQARAQELGLRGWVRNRSDGTVEGLASSPDAAALESFREWLGRGPPRAQVQSLDWTPVDEPFDATGFEVRR